MYTLFIAIGLAATAIVLPMLFGVDGIWTALPGMFVGIGAFVLMSRRIAKRVEAVTNAADQEMHNMQSMAQRGGAKAQGGMMRCIDAAVSRLKGGLVFKKWQLGVSTMLNARIGMLYYTKALLMQQFNQKAGEKQALSEAIPFLEASYIKGLRARLLSALWPAWAMLAVAYYRTDRVDRAIEILESSVKAAKKTGLLWSLYAWLLWKKKRNEEAIAVLIRGSDAASDDRHLRENLTALQNQKGMKMRPYGEQWYQFGLERPKAAATGNQARMGHPRMRGGMRRR